MNFHKLPILCTFILFLLCVTNQTSAQSLEVLLLDSITSDPVAKASFLLIEENNGTVSGEKGIARLGNPKSKHMQISHLNYNTKKIRVSDLQPGLNTIKISPRNPNEIEEVVVNYRPAKWFMGKWVLVSVTRLTINLYGDEQRKNSGNVSASVKEYGADGSFRVSYNGIDFIKGKYTAMDNQINEQINYAKQKELENIVNILFYVFNKEQNSLIVKYQLPNSTSVIEEVWKKQL